MKTDKKHITPLESAYLAAVAQLGDRAYGGAILDTANRIAGAEAILSYGSLYTTLEKLEREGLLTSRNGAPIAERWSLRPRYFRLTEAGLAALK